MFLNLSSNFHAFCIEFVVFQSNFVPNFKIGNTGDLAASSQIRASLDDAAVLGMSNIVKHKSRSPPRAE